MIIMKEDSLMSNLILTETEMNDFGAANLEELITIYFHGKIEPLQVLTNRRDLTCEAVLQKCIKHIRDKMSGSDQSRHADDGPRYLLTFGLVVCPDEVIWIPMNHVFKKSTETPRIYKFRVRCRPRIDRFDNNIMFEYLFLQILDDFLMGPLGSNDQLKSKTLFGLLTIALMFPTTLPLDYTATVNEKFKSRSFTIWNFTKCFSKEIAKKFISQPFIDHYWVHKTIKSRIYEYKSHKPPATLNFYVKQFYKLLMEAVPNYPFEIYTVYSENNENEHVHSKTSSQKEKVHVNLRFYNDGQKTQIALFYGEQLQCTLQDIYSLSLRKPKDLRDKKWAVEIVTIGPPKIIVFEKESAAESFISMIQCYYNLYVNYRKCICLQIQTAGSKRSEFLKSFGPLGYFTAENYLMQSKVITGSDEGAYLIHESLSNFGQYDIHWAKCNQNGSQFGNMQGGIEKSGKIVCLEGTQLLLKLDEKETVFENCLELRRYLRDQFGHQVFHEKLARVADISDDFQMDTISPYCGEDYEETNNKPSSFSLPVIREDLTGFKEIPDKNLLIKKYEVYLQDVKMMLVELQSGDAAYAMAFREGLKTIFKLNTINENSFLKFYNMVLDSQLSVLMEYTPEQDLLTYICKNPQKVCQKVHIIDQIVAILGVMDKAKLYHGNLRLRKFLVFPGQKENFVKIKLGDPGISSFLDTLPLKDPRNVERIPWLSPKRMKNLKKITCKSEVYSVGTTLCELLYRSDQFHEELKLGKDKNILDYLDENKHLPCPPFLADRCEETAPEDVEGSILSPEAKQVFEMVWTMTLRCWTEDETKRPTVPELSDYMKDVIDKTNDIEGDTVFEQMKQVLYDFGVDKTELKKSSGKKMDFADLQQIFNGFLKEKNLLPSCINMNGYKDEIGSGFFGTVWKGYIRPPQKVLQSQMGASSKINHQQEASSDFPIAVAVKRIKNLRGTDKQALYKEAITACTLDHPNVLKCLYLSNSIEFCINNVSYNPLMLITEFMNEGSLTKYSKEVGDLSTPRHVAHMLKIMLDVAEGMVYLSGKSVVHRDLAARNILLSRDNGVVTAKVSDFGLARIMEDNYRFYKIKSSELLPLAWTPPECLVIDDQTGKFSSQGDVWSFGTVMWEAFSKGDTPKNKLRELKPGKLGILPGELLDQYNKGWRLSKNCFMSSAVYNIMKLCWNIDQHKRPPFVELVQKLKHLLNVTK